MPRLLRVLASAAFRGIAFERFHGARVAIFAIIAIIAIFATFAGFVSQSAWGAGLDVAGLELAGLADAGLDVAGGRSLGGETPGSGESRAAGSLLPNGGFERGLEAWSPFWSRESGAGECALEDEGPHSGERCLRIEHRGKDDWSVGHELRLRVRPGEIYELSAWLRVDGSGSAVLGVVTYGAGAKVVDWAHGGRPTSREKEWKRVRSRFVVPAGVETIWPRLIGYGPATVRVDEVALERKGSIDDLRNPKLPASVSIENRALRVIFRAGEAALDFEDRATGRTWAAGTGGSGLLALDVAAVEGPGTGPDASGPVLRLRLLDAGEMREISASVTLQGDAPEAVLRLASEGEMEDSLAWPPPLRTAGDQILILPVNEGIGYPAGDPTLHEMHYHLYGGHGLCMSWYGAMAPGGSGWVVIVETPDDAAVSIPRRDGLLALAPVWEPQKKRFGPDRVLRYVLFERGGHVAMAKRYREHAKSTGLFRTLEEKRKAVPSIDRLVGAVNVWCWDMDAVECVREMQSLGIRRILWSNRQPPEKLRALDAMGVLTSRYDIYQDAMDPANFPRLSGRHGDWTSEAWANDDLMIGSDGEWVRGWEVRAKDGEMLPCGTLCDRQAIEYAKKRMPPELATHPYRARFIDTTTASPWRECWHPKHPMTRSESKRFKVELLRYVSEGCGLVCGSETGHDAAVPWVDYFEGMLSLGPYRVPDSGRDMLRPWDEIPEDVAKFQTGHAYRLPLWELVYHECVVAEWYWGDYSNKLPKLWDRRDLWNALYGTPPMFLFDRRIWAAQKARFARSYRTVAPVARATGYSEMVSHEWWTPDRSVQRTRFANGVSVTVNFGDRAFAPPGEEALPPLGIRVEGIAGE